MQLILIGCFAAWLTDDLELCQSYCQEALRLGTEKADAGYFSFERFTCFNYLLLLFLQQADYDSALRQSSAAKEQAELVKGPRL